MSALDAAPEAPVVEAMPASILLVDDNAAKRLAFRAMLAPLGHEVIEADSGRAALRAVVDQTFAVILMDVRMPTLDGYEAARLIRERPESHLTPVIFVTAFGHDETETVTAYESGAVDFIFSPIVPEVLRAKVSAFVDLFTQAQALQRSLDAITTLNVALRESEVRARAVLESVGDGIVTTGESGCIESFNRAAQRLFGYSEQEVLGRPLQLIIAPSHHEQFADPSQVAWDLLTAEDVPAEMTETVGCRKDGTCFSMELDLSRMQIGERTFTVGCVRDISDRKAYTEALEQRRLNDELTGLPNRTVFGDRVARAVVGGERATECRAVFVLDLNDFRKVNETLGHEIGDRLLQAVAGRLRATMHEADTVARVGGDEFGIVPFGVVDVEAAEVIAHRLHATFAQPFLVGHEAVILQASIGLAFFPQHGRTAPDLVRRTGMALDDAKRSGSGLSVFVAEPADRTAERLTLLRELRDAIPQGDLVLHYQPKVHLATGRTTGVEALVRWQHRTAGLLMPDRFMPDTERSELIEPLTRWVLDAALRQQRRWTDMGLDLTMAVNISARSLMAGSELPATVAELTTLWGIAPDRLILELTENAMIDASAPETLEILHTMGERLSIDDFGTGHSSLVYLQRLPIDQLKVDRSFVTDVASVDADAVIVRSTVDLAHNLGLSVVAEGVEDQAGLTVLADFGCDAAQGYYFSRPVPADDLVGWLEESPYGATATAVRPRAAVGAPRAVRD